MYCYRVCVSGCVSGYIFLEVGVASLILIEKGVGEKCAWACGWFLGGWPLKMRSRKVKEELSAKIEGCDWKVCLILMVKSAASIKIMINKSEIKKSKSWSWKVTSILKRGWFLIFWLFTLISKKWRSWSWSKSHDLEKAKCDWSRK